MKKVWITLILAAAPVMAFAGGPISHLPVKVQLHQEARAAHRLIHALKHGVPVSKITPKMQRLDYALQNTADQMHMSRDTMFAQDANQLVGVRITKANLLSNLKVDAQWATDQEKRLQ